MPYAAALSEHPLAAEAVGEVCGQLIDRLGTGPDLAVLFATAPHTGALEDIVPAVRSILSPQTLLGATAGAVLGGAREVEQTPALVVWAAHLTGRPRPVRLTGRDLAPGALPHRAGHRSLLLIADPFSFPVESLLAGPGLVPPSLTVIGGLASAARGPGGNRLVLDGTVTDHGAVGVLLDDPVVPVVSQGCRPVGEPWIVTRADGPVVLELGGRPALERLAAVLEALPPDDRALAARGLHCGIVIDEHRAVFGRGDFLVRALTGIDRARGALAVGAPLEVGATVQFQVRDAEAADEDLHALLAPHRADAALVFTCNGRGGGFFGEPHHDARVVSELLDTPAVAGMSCAGEIGPVGGRPFLHGFTASVALFGTE